ncbi:hypothetical protein TIFTF001_003822 [Ficus carica]|uniref:Uncharacterized protein n=1 Tax=Ficus carica TaxID=3494 RepID=A0AA87ZV91_FICCA|nr:hypothetical protein TIFTF001_003822 [Ficus carica]
MSSVALLVLLCLTSSSLHACNARLLAFSDKQIGKEIEKVILSADETLTPQPNQKDGKIPSVEFQKLKDHDQAKNIGRIGNENHHGANALRLFMLNLRKHYTHPVAAAELTSSGTSITKSFSQIGLQQSIETKGHEGHARSMLGSAPQDTEEAVDIKEGDAIEDIVVMDYAQPHRKPPIHNEKP